MVEIYGRSGTGKSQLAMQSALFAAAAGKKVLYVDTEGSFRPERMEAVAAARGMKGDGALERIVYFRSKSSQEQMEAVREMESRPLTAGSSMVVIDSLTRNFTLEMPGRRNMASRQSALNVHLSEVARDAFLHRRAYVLTNRVTFEGVQVVGIGGLTVENLVHLSLRLEREGSALVATSSSGGTARAEVGERGVG